MNLHRTNAGREELLFQVFFSVWLVVYLLMFTRWTRILPIASAARVVCALPYLCLCLHLANVRAAEKNCLLKSALFLCIAAIAQYYSGVQHLLESAVWIVAGRNVNKKRVFVNACCLMVLVLAGTVIAARAGYVVEKIAEGDRVRNDLGFKYYSYASHFMTFISFLWISVRKRIRVAEAALLVFLNYAVYLATDTRVDVLLSVTVVVLAYILCHIKLRDPGEGMCKLFSAVPLACCSVSFLCLYFYEETDARFYALNQLFADRLRLGHNAMGTFRIPLFGQYIQWITASKVTETREYNFVDNYYLQCILQNGILYFLFFLFLFCVIVYYAGRLRNWGLFLALAGICVHGMIDPQMGSLVWNPFLLLFGVFFSDRKAVPDADYQDSSLPKTRMETLYAGNLNRGEW